MIYIAHFVGFYPTICCWNFCPQGKWIEELLSRTVFDLKKSLKAVGHGLSSLTEYAYYFCDICSQLTKSYIDQKKFRKTL